jgi:hypothetical protein
VCGIVRELLLQSLACAAQLRVVPLLPADGGNISYINDQSLSCSTEELTQCRIKAVFKTGVPNNESRTGFGATKTY